MEILISSVEVAQCNHGGKLAALITVNELRFSLSERSS
jgi:hypothetical protein